MLEGSIWLELVTLGALVWLGYIGARLASRFHLPSVTGFLLVGIAVGPYGLGLLDIDLLHKIDFVNTLALGLIVFLIGEQLTSKALSRHHWAFWLIAALSVALPAILVGLVVMFVEPGAVQLAWILAAIAMSGAPATVMSLLAETKARGRSCDMLLGVTAFADIATVVAYALVVPLLLAQNGSLPNLGSAGIDAFVEIAGAGALGVLFGLVLGSLLKRTDEGGQLLSLGLTHVLLIVATAQLLGVSPLLAPLVMGITVAVMEERRGSPDRCFNALRTVEYPVYIIFFTLAGAELDVTVIADGGVLMLVYIVARSGGKYLAGFIGGLAGRLSPSDASWFGLGSLPQAGVAVGLALAASQDFPDIGPTITAVVLASIVFFEVVGPLATKKALGHLSCAPETCDLEDDEGSPPRIRTVLVPVSHHWDQARLLHIINATADGADKDSLFVLAHIVGPARGYTEAEAMARGERTLSDLERIAANAGYRVETRLVSARQVEVALASLAEEIAADLVVLGSPSLKQRTGLMRGLVRTPLHRIIDRLDTPVFVVPEDWVPGETGPHLSATVAAREEAEKVAASAPAIEDGVALGPGAGDSGLLDFQEEEAGPKEDGGHGEENSGGN